MIAAGSGGAVATFVDVLTVPLPAVSSRPGSAEA
jgi:hypothetical protein